LDQLREGGLEGVNSRSAVLGKYDVVWSGPTFIVGDFFITHSISNHASTIYQITFNKFSSKKFTLKLFHMHRSDFILMYCHSPGWNTSHTLPP
jgi:hypothetical protein